MQQRYRVEPMTLIKQSNDETWGISLFFNFFLHWINSRSKWSGCCYEYVTEESISLLELQNTESTSPFFGVMQTPCNIKIRNIIKQSIDANRKIEQSVRWINRSTVNEAELYLQKQQVRKLDGLFFARFPKEINATKARWVESFISTAFFFQTFFLVHFPFHLHVVIFFHLFLSYEDFIIHPISYSWH